MVNFTFCTFYHNKKKWGETDEEESHMNRGDAEVPLGKLSCTNQFSYLKEHPWSWLCTCPDLWLWKYKAYYLLE